MAQLATGRTGEWEIVIGMEVHAQVIANSKLFSGSATAFGGEANNQVSFVDAAMPGMLPVLNRKCVEQAIRTGLGLNAVINNRSIFARKNYFYADLPQGYQISQYEHPIVGKGVIEIDLEDGTTKEIGITRLHLEQDAGKSMHDQHPTKSYVDLNRSGCALMEIVSEPDIRGADEAVAYLAKLRMILQYLGTCNGNMEEGSMRADVNVSVRKPGDELGTRAEIKNVNSLKAVQMAIDYEVSRQIELIEDGGAVDQETRLWDPAKGVTRSMRSKEDAHDYRYFPDPDLLPLEVANDWIEEVRGTLPELPDQKKHRFMKDYGLSLYDSSVLIAERERADYFETAAKGRDAKLTANWVINELLGILNKNDKDLSESPIAAEQLGGMIALISDDTISGKIAKDVFAIMYETGKDAAAIVEEKGLKQVTDTGAIEKIVDEVIAENPDNVAAYKSGKDKLFGFFVGQVMKKMQGKANPEAVNKLLKDKLS
ncbi:MAG: Asp-tRNA(Asn)/Glu-tRNA(Gln) amidotransferase subunit GatB [Alphaproteobacteria bacterium]|nr:Asp-tRNA(Asn)/Glu-tRNA(Gln) amidotransferase subunit GatB [Alphaproteobacteria bacterium]MCD8519953.1 Asp-tRNA(Asn)/Glu-tRNA(Gln) amidotransferase subunit GatB [Alphaproteobacteria bacterium]MCD8526407.1 Asp-tRNA(Asn)/Glu-tRNA(Gln) amidotransferase subunit GatB [Alphaproteobacteria bacterium]MCD8571552.1 Asp-tRNA(Asn)/Glu-tRNA(Gln) amidotransferase subunit GatB [Alphaproteobacteria bacterium]